jgi:hypothetical protein
LAVPDGTVVSDSGGYSYQKEPGGYRILSSPRGGTGMFIPEGKYPTVDDLFAGDLIQSRGLVDYKAAGGFFSQLGTFLASPTKEGGPTNAAVVASLAAQYGPGAVAAVQQTFSRKNKSSADLMKDLGRLQAKYAATRDAKKKIQYAYEIQGLKSLIAQVQQLEAGALRAVSAPSTTQQLQVRSDQGGSLPAGLLVVGGLAVVAVFGLLFIASRGKK